jgi:hypothetical protein
MDKKFTFLFKDPTTFLSPEPDESSLRLPTRKSEIQSSYI